MLVGYMRVSQADGSQTTDPQRDALVAAGVDDERLYEDKASGRRDDRPGLAACLKSLRAGDTLEVWKLDRLGWDLYHLVNTVHDLTARRRPEGPQRSRCGDRHHYGGGQARLWDLRCAGRVRA
jgi:DNA invertase Pin-like site-specific DNA recombinase